MLKKIRRTLAVIFFLAILLLFLDFTGSLHFWLGWLAKVQLVPAILSVNVVALVVLALLTLVFGRVYCSVICPLGVMQDLIAWVSVRRKKNPYRYRKPLTWLRYAFLALMIAAMALGIAAVFTLLDPYSSFGMIATHLLQPLYEWGNNVLAAIAEHYNSYAFYGYDVWLRSGIALGIAAALLLIIGAFAWFGGRTYCNTVCPVGTTLGLLSRFSLLKVRFDDDKCIRCGLCARNCKSQCVDHKAGTVDHSRCVVCGNCITKCHKDAIYYGRPRKAAVAAAEPAAEVDKGKRAFLIGGAMAVAGAAMAQSKKKVDGGIAVLEDKAIPERKRAVTPPGSVSARNMQRHCVACQLCVAECPNQVLRPSTDLATLMQPVMSFERGYCRPECTRCSHVCPAGAIKPISHEDKVSTHIGYAVWTHFLCVPTRDKNEDGTPVSCGNCARHCPTGAITMGPLDPNDENSPMVPTVNTAKCIGCGACEYVCPSRPVAAIHVEGLEDHRIG